MRRWWLVPLGIALAGAALLVLARGSPTLLPVAGGPPPLDEIDEGSRERLQQVLEDAEHVRPERGR